MIYRTKEWRAKRARLIDAAIDKCEEEKFLEWVLAAPVAKKQQPRLPKTSDKRFYANEET